MEELQQTIAKEKIMVVITGPNCSGKSTTAQELLKPFNTTHAAPPNITLESRYMYIDSWGVPQDGEVIFFDAIQCFGHPDRSICKKLIDLSKLPYHFKSENHGYMERLTGAFPSKINPASIVIMVSPWDYDACKAHMRPHYLIRTTEQMGRTICRTSS